MGHSSIETTRIYIKSTGREHKEQLDRMDLVIPDDEHTISQQRNIRTVPSKNTKYRKSSHILLPHDISTMDSSYILRKTEEKMINLQNFFNIEETLKKEYRMTHNKYYVAFLEKD